MRLAVIGTFHKRLELTPRLFDRVLAESTRPPDEFWVMCETKDDYDAASRALTWVTAPRASVRIIHHPTPTEAGQYAVIPYSHKINFALDEANADAIVYLDNGSMPHMRKYAQMLEALEANPEWGQVYCTQHRTGFREETHVANIVIPDGYGRVNYTQVMHRPTEDRWIEDVRYANPDFADAIFWRELSISLGPLYPVESEFALDEHYMESTGINLEAPNAQA